MAEDKFWRNFGRGTTIAATVVAGGAAVAGIGSMVCKMVKNSKNDKLDRQAKEQAMKIEQQKVDHALKMDEKEYDLRKQSLDHEQNIENKEFDLKNDQYKFNNDMVGVQVASNVSMQQRRFDANLQQQQMLFNNSQQMFDNGMNANMLNNQNQMLQQQMLQNNSMQNPMLQQQQMMMQQAMNNGNLSNAQYNAYAANASIMNTSNANFNQLPNSAGNQSIQDIQAQLLKFAEMRKNNLITDQEYAEMKAKLLGI